MGSSWWSSWWWCRSRLLVTASSRRRRRRWYWHGSWTQLAVKVAVCWPTGVVLVAGGHTVHPVDRSGGTHRQPRAGSQYWAGLRRPQLWDVSVNMQRKLQQSMPIDKEGASDSVYRQSVGHSCYATETGMHSTRCAEDGRFHSEALGQGS